MPDPYPDIRYYPDTDVLWVGLRPPENPRGRLVDDSRVLHFNDDGGLAAVEVLYASEGADLKEIPSGIKPEVLDYIRRNVPAIL